MVKLALIVAEEVVGKHSPVIRSALFVDGVMLPGASVVTELPTVFVMASTEAACPLKANTQIDVNEPVPVKV